MAAVAASAAGTSKPEYSFVRTPDDTLVVRLEGPWLIVRRPPSAAAVEREIAERRPRKVSFDASGLEDWDTAALTFLIRIDEFCAEREIPLDTSGLPTNIKRLIALAEAVPERAGARLSAEKPNLFARIGTGTLKARREATEMVAFVGEATVAFGKLMVGRARFRLQDLLVYIQEAGAEALPIITLIGFLMGAIFAFVGAVQLEKFGASIYVADLVGIATIREMGAMMTAIVMAGRTGAAYAAQLGSMKVTQEIDALRTMGLSPIEFLVLPRMIALFIMMPLLALYADALGLLGGAAVAAGMLDISLSSYFRETFWAVGVGDLMGGLLKASTYGVLVAVAGCLRGMQSGNSSAAVGEAATSAVVTSIVAIIVACGIYAVLFYILGI